MSHRPYTRRAVLHSLAGGSLLLPGILSQLFAAEAGPQGAGLGGDGGDPLTPKAPLFPAKAKRVIFMLSSGGVSHVDTFDYKQKLFAADGKIVGAGGGLSNEKK